MAEGPRRRVLIVEDDPSLALGLCDALEFEGLEAIHAKSGSEGIRFAQAQRPDCIVLDLMLPDVNGYRVCEEIRRTNAVVPILMLTARSQEADKIRGLDAGADDYVTKPFSLGELVARIRAILRRAARQGATGPLPFRIGDLEIDPVAQVMRRGRELVAMSFYEVELLRLLHDRGGQPVPRDEILEKVWGLAPSPANRTVDNFVVKLRKKIEPQPDKPRYILTVYGIGYRLSQ